MMKLPNYSTQNPLKLIHLISTIGLLLIFGCKGATSGGDEQNNSYYQITTSASSNGSIDPLGTMSVQAGYDIQYTITPDSGYFVYDVRVDGQSLGPITVYTFTNVTSDHTISASFDTENLYVTMGDSITVGVGDYFPDDDVSQDGKNSGGGYQPILNDLLTNHFNGFPHNIVNEGVEGATSAEGRADVSILLAAYPESKKWLVNYGMNDARPWAPIPSGLGLEPTHPNYPGTYKDNVQQIINAINQADKEVCLAKINIALGDSSTSAPYPGDPDDGARNVLIKEYNLVINELVSDSDNLIFVSPPDFYNYFKAIDSSTGNPRYVDQYHDNIHPNGIGYQSMADLWFTALTQ